MKNCLDLDERKDFVERKAFCSKCLAKDKTEQLLGRQPNLFIYLYYFHS